MKKTIITVVGNDGVGIIARVCTYLAEHQVNILDITQTIVQGYFNMMMVTDTSACQKDTAALAEELTALGEELGVVITASTRIFSTKCTEFKETPTYD